VRLDPERVLGLGQDFKKLVVGKEVEPGKPGSLSFEIVAQSLLDHVEKLATLLEALEELLVVAKLDAQHIASGRNHRLAPVLVYAIEPLPLDGELLVYVGRVENGLQVQPIPLDRKPLVHNLGHHLEGFVPVVNTLLEGPLEGGEGHCLGHRDVLVEERHVLVRALENGSSSFSVGVDEQSDRLPSFLHLVQSGFYVVLLSGLLRDLYHALEVVWHSRLRRAKQAHF